ncbi:MAG: glycosyltransferase family 4 protein [Desulfobacterium sp.]|nr:glycosyltransferase family 4 protein [Desulfobacterium sp.]
MKILFINNYMYLRGGAEVSLMQTADLLIKNGHEVCFVGTDFNEDTLIYNPKHTISNIEQSNRSNLIKKIQEGSRIFYCASAVKTIRHVISKEKPDIVHLNNIHNKLSPAVVWEIKRAKIPMVWSLRDFKLVCPSYSLSLKGQTCNACRKGNYINAVINRCQKKSFVMSALVFFQSHLFNTCLKIDSQISCFLPTSKFMYDMFVHMGFEGKMKILPNFLDLDKCIPNYNVNSNKALYFGRLSHEKGLYTLVDAILDLDIDFEFIGDGPEKNKLISIVKCKTKGNRITFLGHISQKKLREKIKNSLFVVLPSECSETFGRTIIESFAMGRPVVGSRIGGIPELVIDNETGLTFIPGDTNDLKKKMLKLINDKELANKLGQNARKLIEKKFQATIVYQRLIGIYKNVIENYYTSKK